MKHVPMVRAAAVVLACSVAVLDASLSYSEVNSSDKPPLPPDVCYDSVGNTRFVRVGEPCKPGEKRMKVAPNATPDPENDPQAILERKVQQLSDKIAKLEADQEKANKDKGKDTDKDQGNDKADDKDQSKAKSSDKSASKGRASRVSAPFEVVASDGTVILRVDKQVSSTDGQGARVTIGGGKAGNYAVRVFSAGNEFVAGVGQAVDGGGLVVVSDTQGPVATMNATNRSVSVFKSDNAVASIMAGQKGGEVSVYNNSVAVVHMSMSSAGDGGNITTTLNNGFGVFSAGAAQDGGGEACVNRVTQAGTRRPACVGLGLPSAGMGK